MRALDRHKALFVSFLTGLIRKRFAIRFRHRRIRLWRRWSEVPHQTVQDEAIKKAAPGIRYAAVAAAGKNCYTLGTSSNP
jgi:hypothetical protein